ncbi:MAG: diaminopimelate decarboxylase [Candidatus Omnitrophica bacterium]|nr:diaminopimelate decarboxylase [Candidatus Omnitrophota bacterium]MDE2009394.1 diaminopimelate decarboxylase [Candidatus Omnitrophota bacterium]MDE2214178.1 diaminopimelate decarboxylase [Candidatus Omnitrophota bacterium]MDE2231215.1 diaminopimelate decarboxylase [Candidatus Omnitrophota bacterium]
MHDFHFKNGELCCENAKVSAIAQRVGTPFYLYSYKTLTDHFLKIQRAFAPLDPLICFAMKSNGNLSVVKSLVELGAGIDIVSIGELGKALLAGADPQKIVFASVGKTEEEIAFAIETGILLFNVESEPELAQINLIAAKMKRRVQAALRINPDVPAPTHEYTNTGSLKKKFGIDLGTARRIFRTQAQYSHVKINGVHIHIGSQIIGPRPFVGAIKKVADFIDGLRAEGITIEYLDIGGGLGIIYKDENPQTAQQYADKVVPILEKTGLKIIMEPGRFIVGNAGIFVTKVLYVKDNGLKKFVIVDGGMNDLIRPMLYDAYHEIVPVAQTRGVPQKCDVVGPICESGDFFAHDRLLPRVKKNDLLAVMSAGAYGYVMSSNYNVRPRVAEVMVRSSKFKIVKERETFKDLVRGEKIISW